MYNILVLSMSEQKPGLQEFQEGELPDDFESQPKLSLPLKREHSPSSRAKEKSKSKSDSEEVVFVTIADSPKEKKKDKDKDKTKNSKNGVKKMPPSNYPKEGRDNKDKRMGESDADLTSGELHGRPYEAQQNLKMGFVPQNHSNHPNQSGYQPQVHMPHSQQQMYHPSQNYHKQKVNYAPMPQSPPNQAQMRYPGYPNHSPPANSNFNPTLNPNMNANYYHQQHQHRSSTPPNYPPNNYPPGYPPNYQNNANFQNGYPPTGYQGPNSTQNPSTNPYVAHPNNFLNQNTMASYPSFPNPKMNAPQPHHNHPSGYPINPYHLNSPGQMNSKIPHHPPSPTPGYFHPHPSSQNLNAQFSSVQTQHKATNSRAEFNKIIDEFSNKEQLVKRMMSLVNKMNNQDIQYIASSCKTEEDSKKMFQALRILNLGEVVKRIREKKLEERLLSDTKLTVQKFKKEVEESKKKDPRIKT